MKTYLKGSLVYGGLKQLTDWYRGSTADKTVSTLGRWYGSSAFHMSLVRYMERESGAESSIAYRVLALAGRKIDLLAGKAYDFVNKYIKSSKTFELYKAAKSEWVNRLNLLILAVVIPFIAGYGLSVTLRGLWSLRKLMIILLLCAVSFLSAILMNKWNSWVRNSAIYRFLKYIWE